MVVTDLHGDWDLYRWYRNHFLDLSSKAEADYLIFTGDLIHAEGPAIFDKSLDIVLDVCRLQEEYEGKVIALLGNHELPHLYGIPVQKGDDVFTARFESALGSERQRVIEFFEGLPFFVRTRAGVSISHSGGGASYVKPGGAETLFNFSHQRVRQRAFASTAQEQIPLLQEVYSRETQEPYVKAARRLLAVSGEQDPRYDDLMLGNVVSSYDPEFQILWETLFNKNEYEYGDSSYAVFLEAALQAFSRQFIDQTALVSGHIVCSNGHKVVGKKQLRIASGIHARPYDSARFLLFDVEKRVESMDDLLSGLQTVFNI